jgi:hypothetical protein
MNYNQIAILFLQGFLVAFLILLLFRLRKKLGLGVEFTIFKFSVISCTTKIKMSLYN